MTKLEALEKQVCALDEKLDFIIGLLQGNRPAVTVCRYTLHSWLDEWQRAYKAPSVKPSTLNTIDVVIRVHIKPNMPDMPLNLLSGLELQKFLSAMPNSRTRKAIHDVLNECLKTAQGLKLIPDNPMTAVKIPAHIQEKGEALTPIELAAFATTIQGHTLERYFLFLLHTGCRRSEALTLRRSDVDFKNKLLHVPGTKTKTSDRTIPLFDKVAALLTGFKPDKDGFYFPFRGDYPTHVFKKLCPAHKLHDLRHTFATRCLEAKIPLKVVQKWLGHSKLDTTADIYSHVTDELNRAEADTLDRYLTQKAAY